MQLFAVNGSLSEVECDVLIVNLFQSDTKPQGATGAVDEALSGLVSRIIAEDNFKAKVGDTAVIRTNNAIPAKKIVLVGLGKRETFGLTEIMHASAAAIRACQTLKAKRVATILHGAGQAGFTAYECARATALGAMLGAYEYKKYKMEDDEDCNEILVNIVELSREKIEEIEQGIARAKVVADAVILARDLANEPSNVATPSYLANVARQVASKTEIACQVFDREEIEEQNMGLLLAVSKGSSQEPRFIEMHYEAPSSERKVAIIGKGVTYDTGGYDLKTKAGLYGSHDDMSGAAAVIACMQALAVLEPSVSVLALVPCVENALGSRAMHPGDIYMSREGKSVEINNTDAEGRLILADAISYAREHGATEIIDLATLTGAAITALGRDIAGLFTTSDEMAAKISEAGKYTGENYWRLPLFDDYEDTLKSDVADMKNHGSGEGAAIVAALFIRKFTGGLPWAHLDLTGSIIRKNSPLCRKGCTGVGTGALIEYIMSL